MIVLLVGALNAFFDRIYTRSKCQQLIKYQAWVFEFSDLGVEVPPVKVSLGGFKTEVKPIEQAGESAKALDHFQYQLCRDLENKTLKEKLDKETWTKYIKTRFAANALVLGFRQTLVAFEHDPDSQRNNLDSIIRDIQNLVRSLTGDVDQKYNTPAGRDAISTAISKGNITDEGKIVDEQKIDELIHSKFDEFEKTQSKILEKITSVEQTFKEYLVKFNLLQSKSIEIFSSESKFNPGKKNCWVTGIFTDREIKSGYDARRPITDEIIKSVEKNPGTIVYGDPYTGKSIILKRTMLELVQKEYVVLYADNVEFESHLLKGLIESVASIYNKLVLIVDNVHKSASENVFKVFNEIAPGKIRFLFAGREKQLFAGRDKELDKNRPETKLALGDIPLEAQYRIEFNRDYATLLYTKALEVTLDRDPSAKEIDYIKKLYHHSQEDPLMYSLGLKYLLAGGSDTLENFIELEMNEVIRKLNIFRDPDIWRAAIFASLIGISDLRLNLSPPLTSILRCSPITLDKLRFLDKEGILLREIGADTYRIQHELIAYEFLSLLYKEQFGNFDEIFDLKYNVKNIIKCMWNNINIDSVIDMLDTCSYLHGIDRYNALSILVSSAYVVPANSYVPPPQIGDSEKVRLFCFGLAHYYYSIGSYGDSLGYYDKALDIDGNHVGALTNKGVALGKLDRNSEAITCFDKVLAIDANDIIALVNKGASLNYLGKNEQAINYFDRVLEIDPKFVSALDGKGLSLSNLHRNEEAITYFDRALEIDPKDEYASAHKGEALIELGRFEEAVIYFNNLLKIDANNKSRLSHTLSHMGLALSNLSRFEEAITYFDRALEIDQNDVNSLCDIAICLTSLDRYEEAITYFDRALEIDANHSPTLSCKHSIFETLRSEGIMLYSQGRIQEALVWYDKALQFEPKNIDLLSDKGLSLTSLSKFEEAIIWYNKALEIDANHVPTLRNIGFMYYTLGIIEKAIVWYDKALKINANDISALGSMGLALSDLSRNEEAIIYFDKLLKIDANNLDALYMKGHTLLNLKRYSESINWLDNALEINSSDPDFWFDRARSYAKLNDMENALKDLKKAIELGGEEYKTKAKNEKDLDNIRTDARFKDIIETHE